jgi:hypothetical protein
MRSDPGVNNASETTMSSADSAPTGADLEAGLLCVVRGGPFKDFAPFADPLADGDSVRVMCKPGSASREAMVQRISDGEFGSVPIINLRLVAEHAGAAVTMSKAAPGAKAGDVGTRCVCATAFEGSQRSELSLAVGDEVVVLTAANYLPSLSTWCFVERVSDGERGSVKKSCLQLARAPAVSRAPAPAPDAVRRPRPDAAQPVAAKSAGLFKCSLCTSSYALEADLKFHTQKRHGTPPARSPLEKTSQQPLARSWSTLFPAFPADKTAATTAECAQALIAFGVRDRGIFTVNGTPMTKAQMQSVAAAAAAEIDVDDSGTITLDELEHVLGATTLSDWLRTFVQSS